MEGPCADSEEKREPVGDIDTEVVDGLKVLDPKWPIREADIAVHRPCLCQRHHDPLQSDRSSSAPPQSPWQRKAQRPAMTHRDSPALWWGAGIILTDNLGTHRRARQRQGKSCLTRIDDRSPKRSEKER